MDAQLAHTVLKLQNFPVSWVEEKVLPHLSAKLANLLERFGELRFKPVAQAESSGGCDKAKRNRMKQHEIR